MSRVTCHVSRPRVTNMLTITGLTLLLIIIFVCLDRSSGADAAAKIYFVSSVVGGCIYANAGI